MVREPSFCHVLIAGWESQIHVIFWPFRREGILAIGVSFRCRMQDRMAMASIRVDDMACGSWQLPSVGSCWHPPPSATERAVFILSAESKQSSASGLSSNAQA